MRKTIYLALLCVLAWLPALADSDGTTALGLLERNGFYMADGDILAFMRKHCGDTIRFNITAVKTVDMFTKEVPDTVWIKKRPKKDAREGKHYTLSYLYKGEPTPSGEYCTYSANISGRPFGVLSVDNVSDGSRYSFHKDILLRLIDLDDLSVVNCLIPHDNKFSFTISSDKIERDIKSITGKEFYVKTGNGYTTPKYTLCTLGGGEASILFDGHLGNLSLQSDVKLHFVDKAGSAVPFKYEKPLYGGHYSDDLIVGRAEHEDRHSVRTISSDVDYELANSDAALPFEFRYFFATPKSGSAYISQRIVPDEIKSYSWTSGYKTIPGDAVMFVGGSLTVRDVKFLKMIYNGKAFFMKADDVKFFENGQAKLDSLESSGMEAQELFWHKTLLINQMIHIDRMGEALKELESLSKHGLAIKSWGVYDESEYTDGTGISFSFLNPTDQVIKYVSVTFQGYNAVDDPYGRPITKKMIGPVGPNETASCDFDYVWFSDVVEYAKIRSITVTYKNGTTKTITNPRSIILSDETLDTIYGSDPVEDFD